MRDWKKQNPLTEEQKRKAICRSYANVYQKRGKLIPKPCEVCGRKSPIEKHHEDYSKPLQVRWLCPEHHRVHYLRLRNAKKYSRPDDSKIATK